MYFYEVHFEDGSWDIYKSKKTLRSSRQVSKTCCKVRMISALKYFYLWNQIKRA